MPNLNHIVLITLAMLCFSKALAAPFAPGHQPAQISLPKTHLVPRDVAVIINRDDPLSIKIGEYYQKARHIPKENLIYINFKPTHINPGTMTQNEFLAMKAKIDKATPVHVQAYAIAWYKPFRVGCMSITTAMTFGYDKAFCARGCKLTKKSPYFNTNSQYPYQQLKIRPSMLLAAKTFADAKQLIDRGIRSDNTQPNGTAYLMSTGDRNRNVRARFYPFIERKFKNVFNVKVVKSDILKNKNDVMFYFTGLSRVKDITTNRYLPGAIADHLTSSGGSLLSTNQMPADDWLRAGATGSYGTVEEPCNFPSKFPNPALAMFFYYKGASLLEAYWKSVARPGQGLFIGEPLAHPFGGFRMIHRKGNSFLQSLSFLHGQYALVEQSGLKLTIVKRYQIKTLLGISEIKLPRLKNGRAYRLVFLPPNSPYYKAPQNLPPFQAK